MWLPFARPGSSLRWLAARSLGRARKGRGVDRGAAAIQSSWLQAITETGLPPPAVQPKQRAGSNGTLSRITW